MNKPIDLKLYPQLSEYISQKVLPALEQIGENRKEILSPFAAYLKQYKAHKLVFICTHNSRRSHLAQIWTAMAAYYYQIRGIETYSGGTELTAFNPNAVAALQRAGFGIEKTVGANPVYSLVVASSVELLQCFSKIYNDTANPSSDFVALLTCNEADQDCPNINGAKARFAIPYLDPKISDGTALEKETYDERCLQIAAECFWVVQQLV